MTLTAFAKKYDDFYVPRFQIDLAGTTFTDASGVISQLSVSTSIEKADHFSFSLNNLYNLERREFEEIDWELLETDGPVRIQMGYGDALEPMLVGSVESAEPTFPANGVPTIAVSGFGRLHELMTGTNTRLWGDKGANEDKVKDSDAVADVVKGYGLKTTIDTTDLKLPRVYQEKKSDYDFLTERAWVYNYEVFVQGDEFAFRAPRDSAPPKLTLGYRDSLLSFNPTLNRTNDVNRVDIIGTDRRGRKAVKGTAEGDDPRGEPKVIRKPVESKAEADRMAKSEVERIRQGRVRGSGETVGIPELVAGATIQLEGVTERFNGLYYVESADHSLSTGGYTTSFRVRKGKGGDA